MNPFSYYTILNDEAHACSHPFIPAGRAPVGETACGKKVLGPIYETTPDAIPACAACATSLKEVDGH